MSISTNELRSLWDGTAGEPVRFQVPNDAWGRYVSALLTAAPELIEAAAERDALKAEVERLRKALRDVLDYYRDCAENDALAAGYAALRGEEASNG